MDLAIKLQDTTLYIRAAVIIKNQDGYIFGKSKHGYIFAAGGKIMLNETSADAAKREVEEELGMKINNLKLISVIENIYTANSENVHEICFYYETDELFAGELPEDFVVVAEGDIENQDLKPLPLKNLLLNRSERFEHVMVK